MVKRNKQDIIWMHVTIHCDLEAHWGQCPQQPF